jgi:hypothetical protein
MTHAAPSGDCRCTPHYAGREQPLDSAVGWAVERTGSLIYMPGCPVHTPPAVEEDRYVFETPAPPPQS